MPRRRRFVQTCPRCARRSFHFGSWCPYCTGPLTLETIEFEWRNPADYEWYANDRHRQVGRQIVAAIAGQGPK